MSRTKKLWVASLIALHAFGIGCVRIDPYIVPLEPKPQPTQHQQANNFQLTAKPGPNTGGISGVFNQDRSIIVTWNKDDERVKGRTYLRVTDAENGSNPHDVPILGIKGEETIKNYSKNILLKIEFFTDHIKLAETIVRTN